MKSRKILATLTGLAMVFSITAFTTAEEVDSTESSDVEVEEGIDEVSDETVVETDNSSEDAEEIDETTEETEATESDAEESVEESTEEEVTETSDEISDETTADEAGVVVMDEEVAEDGETESEEPENLFNYESTEFIPCEMNFYEEITASEGVVRVSPDPNAEVIAVLGQGEQVLVTGYSITAPWDQVEINGQTGYISWVATTVEPAFQNFDESEMEQCAFYLEEGDYEAADAMIAE